MCSIFGSVYVEENNAIKKFIKLNSKILSTRGNDLNLELGKSFIFGSHRLRIVGGNKYDMPYKFKDLTMVFNGEVYNYKLLARKYQFSSLSFESDTHCILEGFSKFGAPFFREIVGMFAAAIFDVKTKELFLLRDQFGVKPLYFVKNLENIYFSSEKKGLTNLNQEIEILKSGEIVRFYKNKLIRKKINFHSGEKFKNFEHLFLENLKVFIPNEKFALLLSGGIDSTLLAFYSPYSVRSAPVLFVLKSKHDRSRSYT